MKKLIHALAFILLAFVPGRSQVLNEHFNSGIPAGWAQNPAGSWTLHPTFGVSGGPCIIAEELGSQTLTASIKTATFNLSGISNPTVNFKAAITKNNFISGDIALYYDQGSGPQFVARWGSGFSANTTYTIPADGFDPIPPLDPENIFWHGYSKTITPINNTVSLIFEAEFVNGGYILFDSIVVTGVTSTPTLTVGFAEINSENAISVFPNPLVAKKATLNVAHFKELMVTNQLGEIVKVSVKQRDEATFELDAADVPPGIYYLIIKTKDDAVVHKKMIVK